MTRSRWCAGRCRSAFPCLLSRDYPAVVAEALQVPVRLFLLGLGGADDDHAVLLPVLVPAVVRQGCAVGGRCVPGPGVALEEGGHVFLGPAGALVVAVQ